MSKTSRLALVACAALVLNGCGASLTDNDKKVCDAAFQKDARGVYAVQSLADNEDIKKHAGRIKVGTTDEADDAAMAEIRKFCEDGGYSGA